MFIVFANIITLLLTYVLFCNTAYVQKTLRPDGVYCTRWRCVIPDIIKVEIGTFSSVYVTLCMIVIPFTYLVCIFFWIIVLCGYLMGILEVFGKSNGVDFEN